MIENVMLATIAAAERKFHAIVLNFLVLKSLKMRGNGGRSPVTDHDVAYNLIHFDRNYQFVKSYNYGFLRRVDLRVGHKRFPTHLFVHCYAGYFKGNCV